MTKEYLGDSVYVEINEYNEIVLTTDNGLGASNTIYLDPLIYMKLVEYMKRSIIGADEGNIER